MSYLMNYRRQQEEDRKERIEAQKRAKEEVLF